MDADSLTFLIPYALSLLITAGVTVVCWRRADAAGAAAFGWVSLGQSLWTLGYIIELLSPTMAAKIFWDDLQFLAGVIWFFAFFRFAVDYTGRAIKRPRLTWIALAIPAVGFVLLVISNGWHGLIRDQAWLITGEPFDALDYPFTPTVWAWAVYGYGCVIVGLALLIERFINPHHLYRVQVGVVVVGTLIPIAGTALTLAGVTFSIHRDTGPFGFAAGSLVIAWGLLYRGLFQIVPVARETVIDNLYDTVAVFDAQNRLVDLNPAGEKVIGRPVSEVLGKPGEEVFQQWRGLVTRFLRAADDHVELSLDREGEEQYYSIHISPIHSRGGALRGRVFLARDITEQKVAEKEARRRAEDLQEANKRLQELSLVKDEFVSNVSHELRTPITNLKLYLDLLKARPDRQDAYLATLKRETGRLDSLIERLLALSRLDQERQQLQMEPVDLNRLVGELVTDRRSLAQERNLELISIPAEGLPQVQADRELVGQVLSVLLTNALNYTPAGGQVVVSTQTGRFDEGEWCGMSVQDTGPGIPSEEQTQLFDRFYRGTAARELGVSGTGLGLAIAHEIIRRHDGRIIVESTGVPGEGSTFHIWLPL